MINSVKNLLKRVAFFIYVRVYTRKVKILEKHLISY
jgi:hypothetical protein